MTIDYLKSEEARELVKLLIEMNVDRQHRHKAGYKTEHEMSEKEIKSTLDFYKKTGKTQTTCYLTLGKACISDKEL